MNKFSFAQRKRSSENRTTCDPAFNQQILKELCRTHLADLFPDYASEADGEDERERMYELYEKMTLGDVAEAALDFTDSLPEPKEDPCYDQNIEVLTFLIKVLTRPFAESARVEDKIACHQKSITERCKSKLDYRFWNNVFFEKTQAKKSRGFCLARMMTFEEYFQTLLSMTDNNPEIKQIRSEYIAEYGALPRYHYLPEDRDSEYFQYHYYKQDRLRALCFHLMYSFEADNEGVESEEFVSCERSAVAAACDLLATPLGILNKHINQKNTKE